MPGMTDGNVVSTGQKRRRTRSGCLNCRRKRKKCDEIRPSCGKCDRSGEQCEWDALIKFCPPTGLSGSRDSTPSGPVVLRMQSDSEETIESRTGRSAGASTDRTRLSRDHSDAPDRDNEAVDQRSEPPGDGNTTCAQLHESLDHYGYQSRMDIDSSATNQDSNAHTITRRVSRRLADTHDASTAERSCEHTRLTHGVALASSGPCAEGNVDAPYTHDYSSPSHAREAWTAGHTSSVVNVAPVNIGMLPDHVVSPSVSAGYHVEDGIFEPGSAYQDLFQSLRSHVLRTAQFESGTTAGRSRSAPTRHTDSISSGNASNIRAIESVGQPDRVDIPAEARAFELSPAQEYLLWKAWTEEVSIWLDKFDPHTHFRDTFPVVAKDRPHLKYAMLSLSARYLESRDNNVPQSLTLALYQHTIQLLLPQLYMRDIAVIASCVILCVLEMFSCSPKAWRRHLDGCASLMQSLDIRGDAGGAEEAVFWCFARMDLCGGLISFERTLIPVNKWTSGSILDVSVKTYPRSGGFQDFAKMASNIIAQAMDLFATFHASEGAFGFSAADPLKSKAYGKRWRLLFDNIQEWFNTRPAEMLPVMAMSAKECGSPFPTVLYSNAAAISGNQFAHTAAILMLQRKPRDITLGQVRSILWHARQICGIALSNDHHGAWTNTVQPVWIAGRLMSHPQEHEAIVRLLNRIEKETGWATQWRIDDLMEYWGDVED